MPEAKKKPNFNDDNPDWKSKALPWIFIVLAIGGIAWMISINKPARELNCSYNRGDVGLTSFGTCSEE